MFFNITLPLLIATNPKRGEYVVLSMCATLLHILEYSYSPNTEPLTTLQVVRGLGSLSFKAASWISVLVLTKV